MHEPGRHFSNTSEHVDTINFPEPTTRQTDKLSVQSKKYRLWDDYEMTDVDWEHVNETDKAKQKKQVPDLKNASDQ